jgi:hypothetical protein
MLGDDTPPPAVPPFWWKLDETAAPFHNSGSAGAVDLGNLYGTAIGGQTPLAPGSTASIRGGGDVGNSALPAPVPGPGGWIVFDWWMAYQVLVIPPTSSSWTTLVQFVPATGKWLQVIWAQLPPVDFGTPELYLRFTISDSYFLNNAAVLAATVCALPAWDDPGHFVWKINPAAGTWAIYMGGALAGSGAAAVPFSGSWEARFTSLESVPAAGWDEFKVYGE